MGINKFNDSSSVRHIAVQPVATH